MVNKWSVVSYQSSVEEDYNVMRRHSLFTTYLFLLLTAFCLLPIPLRAQQPQALAGQPIYAVNAKYVQGVGPGYWPSAGSQLTLNLTPGTAVCNSTVQTYAGGTLTLAANATNYVYLDGSNNCAPASNITGFTGTTVPIAQVATNATSITSITDVRTMFDWAAPSSGSLTSVAMNGDGVIYNTAVPGSPITRSGTLAPQLLTQTANKFLAGPSSGPDATPTFRVIAAPDLPNIAVAGGGTGQTTASAAFKALSPLSTEGDLIYYHSSANARLGVGTNGQCITSNGTDPLWGACGGGSGTVTSVGLSLPSIFSVSGSPVTTSGTLTATFSTESNNVVFAGPSSGGAGLPTFRALIGADLPTPASTSLGGIKSLACGTGQFVNSISTAGGAACATPTGGGGSNYGMGNGTTVIDASLYAGSDFSAKVNAAIGALPSSGGTVDARGLSGTLTMGSSIVVGSDTQPVTLVLPRGMINRASGAQFKYFIGTQIIGQGRCFNSPTCTVIQGAGVSDTAFVYGGTGAYATYVYLANFAVLSGTYGGSASGVGINFAHTMSSRVENVFDWAEVALVVGGANGSCECYNTFSSNDFRGGNDSSGIAVQLLAGANSNYFYSGSYWGYRGVYHGGWGNYFYGPDIEGNTIGFDDAGGGLQIYGGYWEAVGTGILLEAGADGTYISGGFPGMSVVDNSGNFSNFYFNPGAEQQGTLALFPLRFGLQDELLFGNGGLNGYNDFYGIRGDRGGTIGVEVLYEQAMQRAGFNGHAPLILGPGTAYGGFVTVGTAIIQALGAPPAPVVAVQGTPTSTTSCSYALVAHDWNGGVTLPSAVTTISNCPNPLGTLTTPVSVATAGTNYQVNDLVSVVQSGASNGKLKVTTIGSGGAVTGLSVNTVGSGYLTANALPTTGGHGTGLQVNITSIYVTVTPPQMDGVWDWDYLKGDTAHSLATATRAMINDTGQTAASFTTPTTDTTGALATPRNVLDDGSGNMSLAGTQIVTAGSELMLGETGDVSGSVSLHLQNRTGLNGALFRNPADDMVDFGFQSSSGAQQNVRFEHRSAALFNPANIPGEFQLGPMGGQPNPDLVIGTAASFVRNGSFGVGTASPGQKLDVAGGYVRSDTGFCIGANCVTSLTQGTVTSVDLSLPSIFSVTSSPVTTAGTLTATLAAENANTVFGNCTSSSATPAFCTLTGAMLPAPTASTLGGIQSISSTPHQWVSYIDTTGIPYQAAISTGDLPAHLANITNAWCYGTLGSTSGAYYLGGFGGVQIGCGSLTTTLTGGMPLSTPGTVRNLRCAAGAAGHGSSSGVVHVYDNGTSQSLTCTLGTGTGCSDSTNSFTYSTGDLLQFSVASGGSGETLANASCSAEVWVSGN